MVFPITVCNALRVEACKRAHQLSLLELCPGKVCRGSALLVFGNFLQKTSAPTACLTCCRKRSKRASSHRSCPRGAGVPVSVESDIPFTSFYAKNVYGQVSLSLLKTSLGEFYCQWLHLNRGWSRFLLIVGSCNSDQ